ncbi:MAG: Coenzyme F420 hydrogenase/dehydrogenase, beta subunit C-terminal domain [bacterium]
MELKLNKGPTDLETRVLRQEYCCSCGACLSLCPYFNVMQEHVVLMEPCGLDKGRCYEVCPRSVVDMEELNQSVFDKARDDFVLGTHRQVLMSQSSEEKNRESGQYGGTVSSVLIHGLSSGLLDGAVLAGDSGRYSLLPEPVLARSAEDVLACTGSKYTACPSLKILGQALNQCEKLAVVGRPCQVTALRKRMVCEPEIKDRIALVIGLFCMWSLNYKQLVAHLAEKMDLEKAQRMDIPYNRFVVFTKEGAADLEYEPIKELHNRTCDICFDFTSELADLSVGSTEWKEDWNTLITRTEKGEQAVNSAQEAGMLNLEPLPDDRVELLKQASLGKKQRVLNELENGCPLSDYLVISGEEKQAIESGK